MTAVHGTTDDITQAKIERALRSGPDCVTNEATVSEIDGRGEMNVLRPGTNHWVCIPGNETSSAPWTCPQTRWACNGWSTSWRASLRPQTPRGCPDRRGTLTAIPPGL
jgi:hypothetical protein